MFANSQIGVTFVTRPIALQIISICCTYCTRVVSVVVFPFSLMPMKQKERKTGSDLNLKKTRHSKTASPPTTIRVCISLRTYTTAVSNSPTPHRHASIALCRLRRNILSTAGILMRCSAADCFGCQLDNRV